MTLVNKIGIATSILLLSSAASAASYNLSTLVGPNGSVNTDFTVNDATYAFSSAGNDYFSFTDLFDFTYAWASDGNFSAIEISTDGTDIANFSSVSLYNGATLLSTGYTGYLPGGFAAATIDVSGLTPGGSYTMVLEGYAATAVGSQYTMNASPIAAVPEPATLGLMLGGMGMIGFMASRRRKHV